MALKDRFKPQGTCLSHRTVGSCRAHWGHQAVQLSWSKVHREENSMRSKWKSSIPIREDYECQAKESERYLVGKRKPWKVLNRTCTEKEHDQRCACEKWTLKRVGKSWQYHSSYSKSSFSSHLLPFLSCFCAPTGPYLPLNGENKGHMLWVPLSPLPYTLKTPSTPSPILPSFGLKKSNPIQ